MDAANAYTAPDIAKLVTRSGVAKARLTWTQNILRSFMGGVFISLGGLTDLTIVSGCPGLRESNPMLATMIGGFMFPIGFVLIILTGMELCTSNMFIMPFTTLQRRTTVYEMVKNLVVSYVVNMMGCLFVAGFLAWWSDVLDTDTQTAYAVTQAEGRVNVGWSVNLLRGVGCNLFVALAFFMSLGSVEFVSKVYTIWIPIWTFVILGYQHSIANFFMVPIGMFYGSANFGVGKFIYNSVIPVTLGNIIGGALLGSLIFWTLYGRDEPILPTSSKTGKRVESEESNLGGSEPEPREMYPRRSSRRTEMDTV